MIATIKIMVICNELIKLIENHQLSKLEMEFLEDFLTASLEAIKEGKSEAKDCSSGHHCPHWPAEECCFCGAPSTTEWKGKEKQNDKSKNTQNN